MVMVSGTTLGSGRNELGPIPAFKELMVMGVRRWGEVSGGRVAIGGLGLKRKEHLNTMPKHEESPRSQRGQ